MIDKKLIDIKTDYDVENIARIAKIRLKSNVLQLIFCLVLFIASIVTVILFHSYWWVFVLSIIIITISSVLGIRCAKKLIPLHLNNVIGEVVDVDKKRVILKNGFVGYSVHVERKWDTYTKRVPKLVIYIKEDNKIFTYQLPALTEKHADYYDECGTMLHIYGTTYPVKVQAGTNDWLCPICARFNPIKEKNCKNCDNKILK